MWILPSRSRPHNISRLVKAYILTQASTPLLLILDEDDPLLGGYDIDFPMTWIIKIGKRKPLSEYYNEVPMNLDWYGFIADDVVPKTQGWDTKLIDLAGSDGMAIPIGGHHQYIAPHFVLGGDLVREAGFVCLPGLDRIYIDTVWNDIAKGKGVLRYSDAVLEHHHFSNNMALFDKTYKKLHKEKDKLIYENWRKHGHLS